MNRLLWTALGLTVAASAWTMANDTAADEDLLADARPAARAEPGLSRVAVAEGTAPGTVVEGAARGPVVEAPERLDDGAPTGLPERGGRHVPRRDPFGGQLFDAPPPPPPPPKPAAPVVLAAPAEPAPAPPPVLPFTYGGRLTTEAGHAALLHAGPTTHVVAIGDAIEGFRLDADAGGHLAFTHLDSGTRLQLPTRP